MDVLRVIYHFYILFPAKGIISFRQIISSRLYVRLKGACSFFS